MSAAARLLAAALVCAAAVPLYVFLHRPLGYALLAAGLALAVLVDRHLARHLALIAGGLVVISTMSLRADLTDAGMTRFAVVLSAAVLLPYLVQRFVYREDVIRFPWRTGQRWSRFEYTYLGRRGRARLPAAAGLLHRLRRLPELADRHRTGRDRPAVRRGERGRAVGRAVLHLHGVRAAPAALPGLDGQRPAGRRVRVVPVGAGLPELGPGAHRAVRAAAGLHLPAHPLAGLRGDRAPVLRRDHLHDPGARAHAGPVRRLRDRAGHSPRRPAPRAAPDRSPPGRPPGCAGRRSRPWPAPRGRRAPRRPG